MSMSILDRNLEQLLKGLGTPLAVSVNPEVDGAADHGFSAVSEKVKLSGGEIVFGWWLHDMKKYVELEFLCVWKSKEGSIIDLTEKSSEDIKSIVFFKSDIISYEGKPIDNIRVNINHDALVDYLFNIEENIFAMNSAGQTKEGSISLAAVEDDHDLIFLKGERIEVAGFIDSAMGADSSCFCGSGKTFSDCHLQNGEYHTNFIVNKYRPLIRRGIKI